MQQSGPQFTAAGAPAAQSYAAPPVQPYTQSFTQQPQAHPYGQQTPAQPYGSQPPAHPYAPPSMAQPFSQQPYPQPQPPQYAQTQTYSQQQAQPYLPPQTQAAPVPPVPAPAYPQGAGAGQPGAQSAHQAYAQRLITIAKSLEQIIPPIQLSISVLEDVVDSPLGAGFTDAARALGTVKNTAYHHFGALGAIRRFLCGESTGAVLQSLAIHLNRAARLQGELQAQLEQLASIATPDLRTTLGQLAQSWSSAETHLGQAASAAQSAVGTQTWEAARARVFETSSDEEVR